MIINCRKFGTTCTLQVCRCCMELHVVHRLKWNDFETSVWLILHVDILESGSDDFESGEDIYDAVGSILAEVAGDEGDDDIINICNQLMTGLKG